MSRYKVQLASPAAVAVDTEFLWLMGHANEGFNLRGVIIGVRNTAAATAVTDFQCKVGINRVTTDGTGALTASTVTKDKLRYPANQFRAGTAWATTKPTLGTVDSLVIPFNAKSGVELPFEFLDEWEVTNLATDGFAFVNRGNAMPASHVFDITVKIEV
jgi:hypothetical protein